MIRIGCIGAGGRGEISKLAHRPEDGTALVAICDPQDEVRKRYRSEFGPDLQSYADHRELLERAELDAVFVTTPDYLHEEHALAALERGLTVYLEKPMAITIEGCDRILEAAARRGGRLYVGHNMRFFPVMRKMKEIIDAGTIGEVQAIWCRQFVDYGGDAYFKDWHSERRYCPGLLLQKGSHDIDMIHWFGGGYTRRTVGMGKLSVYNRIADRRQPGQKPVRSAQPIWPPCAQSGLSPVIEIEDHSMMLMELDNGVQASYTQVHYSPDGYRSYTIIGTEGRMENDGDHSTSEYEATIRLWTRRCGHRLDQHERVPLPPLPGTHGGADPQVVNDFLRFIKTGQSDGATPVDARMSVAAGLMATHSLRSGNVPTEVPPVAW